MSLLNPWVILSILIAIGSAAAGGYSKGKDAEYQRQQLEITALNAKARETEKAMAQVAQTYGDTLRKANNAARVKETKLRADIATGERKLFIPVKATVCPVHTPADTTVTSGNTETRAELDSGVAQALVDLTSRGDQAIRSLNACIDQYEKMRGAK